MNNDFEDRKLMDDFKSGDENAFEILFEKYSNFIKMYINKKIHNTEVAEEMMQEIFVFVYKHPERYKGKSKFINYVFGITKNKIKEYLRREKFSDVDNFVNEDDLSEDDRLDFSSSEELERREESKELFNVLKKLKPEYRRVIELIDLQELSYEDAARKMDKSVDQIRVTIHRARKKLKEEFTKEYPDTARKYSKRGIIPMLLAAVIGVSLLTGLVYAAIRFYKSHVQNKESFRLEEINEEIDEDEVEIDREHAKRIIGLYLDVLGYSDYNLEDVRLMNDAMIGKIEWTLKDDRFEIWIDGNDGKIIRYDNQADFNKDEKYNYDESYYIDRTSELIKRLKIGNEYELYDFKKYINGNDELTTFDIIYTTSSYDLNSNYKYIIFRYIFELNFINSIKIFDYTLENNLINIDEKDAKKIIISRYENPEIIDFKLENKLILNNNNEYANDSNYLTADLNLYQLKTVWTFVINNNNILKIIYVDAEDGNIILVDEYSYGEKKKE